MLRNNAGFTLVELVVVILVITILAAAFFPRLPGGGIAAATAAQQVAADIRYTQNLSMTQGEKYRFTITSTTTYTISRVSNGALQMHPVTGLTTTTLPTNFTFGTLVNLPSSILTFNGKGVPYTNAAGTTLLSSQATIPLIRGSDTKNIIVYPDTGTVVVQ